MAPEFDPAALHEHRAFLRALAASLLADADAAEDVVQDASVAWWSAPPRSADAPRAWLARVTRNLALNARRERERRAARERVAAREERVAAEAEADAGLETQRRVLAAVMALREPYRTVVWLRWYEDLPPRAIAERTGSPVETVKSQLKRALAELRARLDAEFGDRRGSSAALLALVRPPRAATPAGVLVGAAALVLVVGIAIVLAVSDRDAARDPASDLALLAVDGLPDEPGPSLAEHPAELAVEPAAERIPLGAPGDGLFRGRALDAHDESPLPELDLRVHYSDGSTVEARTALDGTFAVARPARAQVDDVVFLEGEPVEIAASRMVGEDQQRFAEYALAIGPTYALDFALQAGLDEHALDASIWIPGRRTQDEPRARVRPGARPWVRFPRAPRLSLVGAGQRSMYVLALTSADGSRRALARVHASQGTLDKVVPLAFEPAASVQVLVRGVREDELASTRVEVEVAGAPDAFPASSRAERTFVVAGLPPGPVRVRVRSPREQAWSRDLVLEPRERRELDVRLPEDALVSTSVRYAGLDDGDLPEGPARMRRVGEIDWRDVPGIPAGLVSQGCAPGLLAAVPGEYELVPPFARSGWDPPVARITVPDARTVTFHRRPDAGVEQVVVRATDATGRELQRFRAHVVLDRLGRGRKAAVELEEEGLVRAAHAGVAPFEGLPRGARGWWLVEADGFQSAWGELAAPDRGSLEVRVDARLLPAWSCTLAFRSLAQEGRERSLRGVHVRTKGGRLLATSLGDGEARLELLYDPGELVLELPGWRVASWDGFRGGKRTAELDLHRVVLERER